MAVPEAAETATEIIVTPLTSDPSVGETRRTDGRPACCWALAATEINRARANNTETLCVGVALTVPPGGLV
jgi:hypothetical protein